MKLIASPKKTNLIRFIMLTLIMVWVPITLRANCLQNSAITAMGIYYDASDALNLTGYASFAGSTNYPGTFTCTTPAWGILGGKNTVDNSSPYSQQTIYLKYPGNAYVSLNVTKPSPQETHPKTGTNNGSDIDATFTVSLKLMKTVPTKNVMTVTSNIAKINPVVLAQDSTGLTILQNIARMINDLAYFIFNWSWPQHNYDIYYKPLLIRFVKQVTTCSFDDNNKTVLMDNIDISSLSSGAMDGKKSFTLNFSCNDLLNGTTSRNVSAYLSSNTILPADNTVLTSTAPGSAAGVGIRIANTKDNIPIKFSSSSTAQGDATTLFSSAAHTPLSANFALPMYAWYYVYNRKGLSSGPVRTTAVVNFVYD